MTHVVVFPQHETSPEQLTVPTANHDIYLGFEAKRRERYEHQHQREQGGGHEKRGGVGDWIDVAFGGHVYGLFSFVARVKRQSLGSVESLGEPAPPPREVLTQVHPHAYSLVQSEAAAASAPEQYLRGYRVPVTTTPTAAATAPVEYVLQGFDGRVVKIVDNTGYVTLTDSAGRQTDAEIDANELASRGIGDRDRFRCEIKRRGPETVLALEKVARRRRTPEEMAQIDAEIAHLTGKEW